MLKFKLFVFLNNHWVLFRKQRICCDSELGVDHQKLLNKTNKIKLLMDKLLCKITGTTIEHITRG